MRSASGGPRVLLRRLREVMAEQVSAQERLDKIVVLIAANMVAEVCSTYVLRVDNTLELYATEGLNRETLVISQVLVDEGPTMKRWRPRAKGSANRIFKRTSHLTVVVTPAEEAPKPAPKAKPAAKKSAAKKPAAKKTTAKKTATKKAASKTEKEA